MRWSGLPGSLAAERAAKRAERGWVSWAARVGLRRGEGVGLLASGPGEGKEKVGRAGLSLASGWAGVFLGFGLPFLFLLLFLFLSNSNKNN